jgi:enoyl-CoA hydratase/carnithine racemase
MTGERFTAAASKELGIIHETTAKEELLDKAVEVADMLGMKDPKTYADYKRDMRESTSALLLRDAEEYIVPGI